ncbi:uncharacterized protein MELLADRAFT_114375 [Melampsora larici-populina 98AG31]|uniref:Secreted protein n=1 Tax=Melampsora larici-populina (strain 98AG31 / pathotype 3-4-7) TaxID=747676 RepID=F4RWR4_MELLP|nr:uncharacterized protein MELLADRAFT_109521 [Melampsora larici-populina 98AG31]XP_007419337.1 uncharacterized protein MELLADRAFT_114375 [Melampsora larici-populina 98AG31]EGF97384.1 secreted protein [Melampsora larici-populina 98AG31]EGG03074.1 secreted protein [Melampsora larici-populina 98AG31]
MQFIPIVSLLLLSWYSSVSGTCFTTGPTWGDANQRKILDDNIENLCRQMTGKFAVGAAASRCLKGGEKPGNRYDFLFRNVNKEERTLTMETCTRLIRKDIATCPMGAYNQGSNWWYTSDPNEGECLTTGP